MNSLLITRSKDGDDWSVWMSLEQHHPVNDCYGFVIGSGDTRDAAVAEAVASLEDAVDRLQAPIGVVDEEVLAP